MKCLTVAAALALVALANGAHAADTPAVVVSGSGEQKTYDCSGGAALVGGSNNTLTLAHCAELTVRGDENTINAGTARAITIEGKGNKVQWTHSRGAARPTITDTGEGNQIVPSRPTPAAGEAPTRAVPHATGTLPAPGTPVAPAAPAAPRAPAPKLPAYIEPVAIMDDGQTGNQDCKGLDAVVNSNNNTLGFKSCADLTVNGDDNTLDTSSVKTIVLNGDRNKLTWSPGPDGSEPEIIDHGDDNTITKAAPKKR
jgi:hypothetical protein